MFSRHFILNIVLGFILSISLSCGFMSSGNGATSDPKPGVTQTSGEKVIYKDGLEVEMLPNGLVLVKDQQGRYGMAFPENWKVGPITEEFYSVVKEANEIHPFVGISFGGLLENRGYNRIFAFDSSSNHLNRDSFTVLTVSSTIEQGCTNLSVSEIGDATIGNVLGQNPDMKLMEATEGKSQFEIPWFFFSTVNNTPDLPIIYTGVTVANTGYSCLKMTYLTNNKDVNILSELELTLNSIASFE